MLSRIVEAWCATSETKELESDSVGFRDAISTFKMSRDAPGDLLRAESHSRVPITSGKVTTIILPKVSNMPPPDFHTTGSRRFPELEVPLKSVKFNMGEACTWFPL